MAVARTSPFSLYREDLATFGEDAVYDQADATGFLRLWGLPTEVHGRVRREAEAAAVTAVTPVSPVPVAPGRPGSRKAVHV